MRPGTILVVDDEYYIAEVLAFLLEGEGYRVLCASNGRDALEKLKKTTVDLVILDVMMPVMNGAELARAMRTQDELTEIPILMTSALPESGVRAMSDQYDAFLRKPFPIKDVLVQVTALLAGKGDGTGVAD